MARCWSLVRAHPFSFFHSSLILLQKRGLQKKQLQLIVWPIEKVMYRRVQFTYFQERVSLSAFDMTQKRGWFRKSCNCSVKLGTSLQKTRKYIWQIITRYSKDFSISLSKIILCPILISPSFTWKPQDVYLASSPLASSGSRRAANLFSLSYLSETVIPPSLEYIANLYKMLKIWFSFSKSWR